MRFSGFFVVSSLVFSTLALPAPDFAAQLNALSAKVDTVTTQVQNFDGTASQFDSVHMAALSLAQSASSTNDALKPYPSFTATESAINIAASSVLIDSVGMLADALIAKKPAFAKIPGGIATVHDDARNVTVPAFKLVQGLIDRIPNGDLPKAHDLQKQATTNLALPAVNFVPQLTNVSKKLDSLTAQTNAFPSTGGTVDEALNIYGTGVLLRASLGRYTRDLGHFPVFNEVDSRANIKAITKEESSAEASINALVAKKDAFKNLPGTPNVLEVFIRELEVSSSASEVFHDMLIAHTYPTHVQEAKALRDKLTKKFKSAVAALKSG
ncbi:hypothetical protein C0995_000406 [Termitomyces sp. Mi166|nr:hypothetical protein C0995_000406 [Termitomyces sp. Mi166\